MKQDFIPQQYRDAVMACLAQSGSQPGITVISFSGLRIIEEAMSLTPGQAMGLCLENGVWPSRFARNAGFLAPTEQALLLQKRAAVIGCGALGGYVAMYLARMGLGAMTLCDPDVFEESNLNRQLFAKEDNLGKSKALEAQKALKQVASHMETSVFPAAATAVNLPRVLHGADIAIDCLDSLQARKTVESGALALGIPFIHGSLAGLEGFAALSLPGETGAVERLYGSQADIAGSEKAAGLPSPTPAFIACLEATLCVQTLLAKDNTARERLNRKLVHADLSQPAVSLLDF